MAEDWKEGDLALITVAGRILCDSHPNKAATAVHTGLGAPAVGSVREVSSITPTRFLNGLTCKCVTLEFIGGGHAVTQRCRKIHPHQPDEQDEETISLLLKELEPAKVHEYHEEVL